MSSLIFKFTSNNKIKRVLSKRPGDEGFSLVELVVVIAVLAILSAVAIPAFQGVQARAKTSAVKNGLVNGVKECIVQAGLDLGTSWLDSSSAIRAKAFAGQYSGYSIDQRNKIDSCYTAEATPAPGSGLPWFTTSYDPLTGITTNACDKNIDIGCKNGTW